MYSSCSFCPRGLSSSTCSTFLVTSSSPKRMCSSLVIETTSLASLMGVLAACTSGRSMCSPLVSRGAVTMKTMSSTSMTSTRGVTLISRITPPPRLGDERLMACPPSAPRAADQLDGVSLLGHQSDPRGRRSLELGDEVADALVDPVVEEDRRDGGGQADGRGDERLADGRRHDGQAGGLGVPDADEGVHDAVHRAEPTDERRAGGDEREKPHERAGGLTLGEDGAVGHRAQPLELRPRAAHVQRLDDSRPRRDG